jgi:flagellar motility protein MotE (MotC chaperone)
VKKWLLAISLLIIAAVIAVGVLQATGVVNLRPFVIRRVGAIPALAPHLETYRAGRDAERRLQAAMAEMDAMKDDLIQREMELDARAQALTAEERKLARDRQALDEERQDLLRLREEVETTRSKLLELERMRSIYAEMRGRDAAVIMRELRPELIAFILAGMEPEAAGDILANLDPKLAAEITRMTLTDKK